MRQTDTHLRARKALLFIKAIRDLRPSAQRQDIQPILSHDCLSKPSWISSFGNQNQFLTFARNPLLEPFRASPAGPANA